MKSILDADFSYTRSADTDLRKTFKRVRENMSRAEWSFSEPPEEVNLNRLWNELRELPATFAYSYLSSLRENAPLTYERLRQQRLAAGCTIFAWPPAKETPAKERMKDGLETS